MNFKSWLLISEMAIFSPKYFEINSLQALSETASDPVLKARYKFLISEWDKKNNTLTPSDVTPGNGSQKINWKCKEGHTWAAPLSNRTSGGNNCSCCSNRQVCKDNNLQYLSKNLPESDLKARYKRLVSEWDKKNNTLTPKNVLPGSNKKINWKCEKGHTWTAQLNSRVNDGRNCPCCSNNQVCKDNNLQYLSKNLPESDLKARYKRLVSEWDKKNNTLTPKDITPGSDKEINWKCKKEHMWTAKLYNRTSGGKNCPICNESKGEEEIFKILQNYISPTQITRQYQDIDCRGDCLPLPFDFIVEINGKKYFIEYNGEQHYRPTFGSTPDERQSVFEKTQRYDKVKLDYCRSKNIPFLVIPYTKYKNIDTIISSFLKTKTFDSKFAELEL
jgi:Probable Zinc-ribbon domain